MIPWDCRCPKCLVCGSFIVTGGWVLRGIVWLNDNQIPGYQQSLFPLARCNNCGFKTRVLSCEVLPYKTYTLPVIEQALKKYVPVDSEGLGLRQTVKDIGGDHPHFSTLHRWLAGLGERVLDRPVSLEPAKKSNHNGTPVSTWIPTAALFAETEKKLSQNISEFWQRDFCIPDWKYRSAKRYDQLLACLKLIFMASCLFTDVAHPLTKWNAWLIAHFHVAAWYFSTGLHCTSIQHPPHHQIDVKDSKHLRKEMHYDSRSPPNRLLAI